MSPVVAHVESNSLTEAEAEATIRAVTEAMHELGVTDGTEMALVFVDDEEIRRLSRKFRRMDQTTDVLSFPAGSEHVPDGEPPCLGDVIISVDSARVGAGDSGHDLVDELRLLAVHGLLHLLGHEDESPEGALAMHDAEVELGVRRARN